MNVVVLRGRLSSAPVTRELPSGSLLVSLEVSTDTAEGTVSAPVVWIDPGTVPDWAAGQEVVVVGTVKRRFFRTAAGTQSRTEVLATAVVDGSRQRTIDRLLARVRARLGGVEE